MRCVEFVIAKCSQGIGAQRVYLEAKIPGKAAEILKLDPCSCQQDDIYGQNCWLISSDATTQLKLASEWQMRVRI